MTQEKNSPTPKPAKSPPWGTHGRFKDNLFIPLRLGLALLVLFSHSYPLTLGSDQSDPLMLLTGYHTLGSLAVDMFLAMSGFLVASSWDSSASTWSFLRKRVLRIYPAFVVLMLLQAFVLAPLASSGPFSGYSWKQLGLITIETVDLVGYGYPYGGLLNVFPNNPFPNEMNGSLWTVRYEFVCYLLLAVAGGFRHPKLLAIGFAALLVVHLAGWLPPWHKLLTATVGAIIPWPRLLCFFLAGVLFYRLRDQLPHNGKIAFVSFVALMLAAFTFPALLRLALPTAGVYLLLWVAYHPRVMCLPKLHSCDLSYGTYLYAFPIQQCLMLWLAPHFPMTPWKLTLVATLCTLPVAALSWYAIEKPFLSLKLRPQPTSASSPTSASQPQ